MMFTISIQKMFLVGRLKSFDVSQSVLGMKSKCHVESILLFNIMVT